MSLKQKSKTFCKFFSDAIFYLSVFVAFLNFELSLVGLVVDLVD